MPRPRRSSPDEDHEPSHAGSPAAGEVWWCEGANLGLRDGAKVRPVLVLGVHADGVRVIPLTSRKPESATAPPVGVAHRGGLSWMTTPATPRSVEWLALLSSLGGWQGFEAWRRKRPHGETGR